MIDCRFLPAAEEELTEAAEFYEAASSRLGVDFLDDVQRALDAVRESTFAAPVLAGTLRRALLHRFPFSAIYSVEPSAILVVAIAHQRRRPGYSKKRILR